jgi:hypothetical protein
MTTYRAELLRACSRTTLVFLLLCIVFTLFSMGNAGPQGHPPLQGFRDVAILTATLLMGRGAVVAANDFSTGTIRPWLISRPSRISVFTGKLAASVTIALGAAVIIGLVSFAASGLFGQAATARDMAVATGQFALACAALTIFGHAVGVLTRSVPAALAVTIAWVLPAEKVLQGRSSTLDQWLPGNLLQDFTLGVIGYNTSPAAAVLHATVPFILLDVVALVLFARRDINS